MAGFADVVVEACEALGPCSEPQGQHTDPLSILLTSMQPMWPQYVSHPLLGSHLKNEVASNHPAREVVAGSMNALAVAICSSTSLQEVFATGGCQSRCVLAAPLSVLRREHSSIDSCVSGGRNR